MDGVKEGTLMSWGITEQVSAKWTDGISVVHFVDEIPFWKIFVSLVSLGSIHIVNRHLRILSTIHLRPRQDQNVLNQKLEFERERVPLETQNHQQGGFWPKKEVRFFSVLFL